MAKRFEKRFQKKAKATTKNTWIRRVTVATVSGCLLGATAFGCFATVLAQNALVTATIVDGNVYHAVTAPSNEVDVLLKEAGIVLEEGDTATLAQSANGNVVTVHRQLTFTVTVDGNSYQVTGQSGDTVAQVLEWGNIAITKQDVVQPPLDTVLEQDGMIAIVQQVEIKIKDGTQQAKSYLVGKTTAQKAVEEAGITLTKLDKVENGDRVVKQGDTITIVRVTEKTVEKAEPVPYETIEKETDTLAKGTTKVETEGQEGQVTVTYRQTLENGKVTAEEEVKREVTTEPVHRVVLVGTKVVKTVAKTEAKTETKKTTTSSSTTNNTQGQPIVTGQTSGGKAGFVTGSYSYSGGNTFVDQQGRTVTFQKVLTGSGTAYTFNGKNKTATGVTPYVGIVAVNPSVIPYGTRLFIASADGSYVYGYAVAGDTGGALKSGAALVDLFMNSKGDCTLFGRRNVNVFVLG